MSSPDYSKVWSSGSSLTPYEFSDADYLKGWEVAGSIPPARTQFDALQRTNDLKTKDLNTRLLEVEGSTSQLTIDDTVAPTSNQGALATIMNNVANMLKQVKGDNDWKTAPGISLAAILGDFATNLSVTTDPDTGVFTCASLGITGLMAQNGYICLGKLFGGLILQWGYAGQNIQTYPIAFPLEFTATPCLLTSVDGNSSLYPDIPTYTGLSATGFTWFGTGASADFPTEGYWLAIGY